LIHERHELVGKPGHRAADTNPANIGTAADPVYPSAFSDIALNDGSPASQFHYALGKSMFVGEIALLIIAAAVTALMDRGAE
jgi:hypothetical protein